MPSMNESVVRDAILPAGSTQTHPYRECPADRCLSAVLGPSFVIENRTTQVVYENRRPAREACVSTCIPLALVADIERFSTVVDCPRVRRQNRRITPSNRQTRADYERFAGPFGRAVGRGRRARFAVFGQFQALWAFSPAFVGRPRSVSQSPQSTIAVAIGGYERGTERRIGRLFRS